MRPIDADKLNTTIDAYVDEAISDGCEDDYEISILEGVREAFHEIVNQMPTAAVQPVIRCKDCKFWSEPNMFDSYCRKTSVSDRIIYTQSDHYCSFAERKDDA